MLVTMDDEGCTQFAPLRQPIRVVRLTTTDLDKDLAYEHEKRANSLLYLLLLIAQQEGIPVELDWTKIHVLFRPEHAAAAEYVFSLAATGGLWDLGHTHAPKLTGGGTEVRGDDYLLT